MSGKRLNPRKADLHRWREAFAEKLRGWGVEAEATRQATRGAGRRFESLWQIKAREDGRLRRRVVTKKSGEAYQRNRIEALKAWAHIVAALRASDQQADRELAGQVNGFIQESAFAKEHGRNGHEALKGTGSRKVAQVVPRSRTGPEIER